MNLKIDIIDRAVILYLGDKVLAQFNDVSSLEIKDFGRIKETDNVLTWATTNYYSLSSGLHCGSGGISKQPYGYIVKDGEVMRIEGGGGGSASQDGESPSHIDGFGGSDYIVFFRKNKKTGIDVL